MQTRPGFLLISYYFPPVKVVGAVRLFHFSQVLTERGVDVFVVTCRNRKYFQRDTGLEPAVRQIRTAPAWDWRSLRLRCRGDSSPTVGAGFKNTRWGRWLSRAQESFPLHFLLGDGGLIYLWIAYRQACRYVREQSITHVFSSYRPYADHWVAWLLKLRYPRLYWIADFRDLHVDPVRRNVWWPRLQRWADRRLLRRADLVTTVSQGLASHLPAPSERRHVLRNAIPARLLERRPEKTPRFTIVYTGSIYPGLQDARPLFRVLARLLEEKRIAPGRLQLIYQGKDGAVWDDWLRTCGLLEYGQNRGEQDREDVLRQQCASSLNLLLSWSAPRLHGVLTSKLYEYLSAGVPLLALVNGPADVELAAVVERTGGGRVLCSSPDQEDALQAILMGHYRIWLKEGVVKSAVGPDRLRPYTWAAQVDGLWTRIAH